MKKTKITKEDLKNPDAFVSATDKIVLALEKHRKAFYWVVGIAFLAGAGKVSLDLYTQSVEEKAAAGLFSYENQISNKKEELAKKEEEKETEADDKETKNKKVTKKEEKPKVDPEIKKAQEYKELEPIISKYIEEIKRQSKTKAAVVAALDLSHELSQYNQHEQALEVLKSVSGRVPKKSVLYGLMYAKLGGVYSNLAQHQKALEQFQKILDNPNQKYAHSEMLLRMGICNEKLKKYDTAKEIYNRINNEYSGTEASRTAKSYLKLLNLQSTQDKG